MVGLCSMVIGLGFGIIVGHGVMVVGHGAVVVGFGIIVGFGILVVGHGFGVVVVGRGFGIIVGRGGCWAWVWSNRCSSGSSPRMFGLFFSHVKIPQCQLLLDCGQESLATGARSRLTSPYCHNL